MGLKEGGDRGGDTAVLARVRGFFVDYECAVEGERHEQREDVCVRRRAQTCESRQDISNNFLTAKWPFPPGRGGMVQGDINSKSTISTKLRV